LGTVKSPTKLEWFCGRVTSSVEDMIRHPDETWDVTAWTQDTAGSVRQRPDLVCLLERKGDENLVAFLEQVLDRISLRKGIARCAVVHGCWISEDDGTRVELLLLLAREQDPTKGIHCWTAGISRHVSLLPLLQDWKKWHDTGGWLPHLKEKIRDGHTSPGKRMITAPIGRSPHT
jgi:hypothetical protein